MKNSHFRFGRLKGHGSRGRVQTETLSGEVHSDMRNPQPHGFESKAPLESETYACYQDGNTDNGAVLTVAGYAPIVLDEGDSVMYSAGGATVHCKDGKIELNGAAFGGLIKIDELTSQLNALVAQLQAHSHVSAGAVNTGTFNTFTASSYENEDVNHG